jgi:Amt family ammonium transporter
VDGLIAGNVRQVFVQVGAVLAVLAYSGLGTWLILLVLGDIRPLRADVRHEGLGMDVSQHGEEAYARDEGAILVLPN